MPYVTHHNVRIHYEVEGQGPPLMLHHGFSDSLDGWRSDGYVDALKRDYRLILLDARGHGASDRPHDAAAYSVEQRVADVVAVLDDLGLAQVCYWGYSLGGWVGFGLARYAPERLRALVIGGAQPYGQSLAWLRLALEQGLASWVATIEQLAGPMPPERKERWFANDVLALRAQVAQDRPHIAGILPTMTMPCLLYAGEADPLCPLVERCAAELPNASFFSLPGLNHLQVAFARDLVAPRVLSFLTSARTGMPSGGDSRTTDARISP